jgi:hypothetical protein
MSEQKKPHFNEWRSEPIETPKQKGLGRRDILKLARATAGIGLLAFAAHKALPVMRELGYFVPTREAAPALPISPEEAQAIETAVAPTLAPTPFGPVEPTPEETRTPIVQREGEFAGIDFFDTSTVIDMGIFLDNLTIPVPQFNTLRFREGILSTEEFAPYMNTVMVWRDGGGRMQIDGHSGWYDMDEQRVGFTFTPWQLVLEETPQQTARISPAEVDERILNDILGRQVMIRQGGQNSLVEIVAGVRVPPGYIPDSKRHVADIIPWLAETFPNHGFEQVLNEDPWNLLVVKFCGRNLVGEPLEQSRTLSGEESVFRQARFFFVLQTR